MQQFFNDKVKEKGITKMILEKKREMEEVDRINRELFQHISEMVNWVFNDINGLLETYFYIDEHNQALVLYAFNDYCIKHFDSYSDYGRNVLNHISNKLEEADSDYNPFDNEYNEEADWQQDQEDEQNYSDYVDDTEDDDEGDDEETTDAMDLD